jgi:hypothetical protein
MNVIVRVLNQVPRLLRNLNTTSMYTVEPGSSSHGPIFHSSTVNRQGTWRRHSPMVRAWAAPAPLVPTRERKGCRVLFLGVHR